MLETKESPGSLEKWVISGLGQIKNKMNLKRKKKEEGMLGMPKRHRS